MGLFFDIKTPADQKLMEGYDVAVNRFRTEVATAMEIAALQEPSIAKPMLAAAAAMRARPLPSEANSDEAALRRLTLSSVTIEKAFSSLQSHADSQEALNTAAGVLTRMRAIGSETSSAPEYRPLTQAVMIAVGGIRAEVAAEMKGKDLDAHVAALQKPAAQKPAAPAHKGPRP